MARKAAGVRDLIILGTGVHGSEMVEIVERINGVKKTWNLLGFLSASENAVGREANGFKVLGTSANIPDYGEACFVPDNEFPRNIAVPRERLVSIIDPSTFVSRTATIGKGCVIYPNCYIGLNAKVGDYVFALSGSCINHDDVIEDRTVFASGVTLAGSVHVEADCYLGQSCTVRQFTHVGCGSLIGMGAVVIREVPPNSVMVGNPARRLRDKEAPK
jgi:sugar O-acyltransferase (sialic acid O-acetyltransferase NeuD family)